MVQHDACDELWNSLNASVLYEQGHDLRINGREESDAGARTPAWIVAVASSSGSGTPPRTCRSNGSWGSMVVDPPTIGRQSQVVSFVEAELPTTGCPELRRSKRAQTAANGCNRRQTAPNGWKRTLTGANGCKRPQPAANGSRRVQTTIRNCRRMRTAASSWRWMQTAANGCTRLPPTANRG